MQAGNQETVSNHQMKEIVEQPSSEHCGGMRPDCFDNKDRSIYNTN